MDVLITYNKDYCILRSIRGLPPLRESTMYFPLMFFFIAFHANEDTGSMMG